MLLPPAEGLPPSLPLRLLQSPAAHCPCFLLPSMLCLTLTCALCSCYMSVCVFTRLYVSVYVCDVFEGVFTYMCVNICMWIFARMYMHMWVFYMQTCAYGACVLCTCACGHACIVSIFVRVYTCVQTCMCACCLCMCVYGHVYV